MTNLASSHSDLDLVLRDHPAHDLGRLYGATLHQTVTDRLTIAASTYGRAMARLEAGRAIERAARLRQVATDRDDEAAAAYWYGVELALAGAGQEEPS